MSNLQAVIIYLGSWGPESLKGAYNLQRNLQAVRTRKWVGWGSVPLFPCPWVRMLYLLILHQTMNDALDSYVCLYCLSNL